MAHTPWKRRYPFVLVTALVLVIALVPAGLKKSELLTRAAHQATVN